MASIKMLSLCLVVLLSVFVQTYARVYLLDDGLNPRQQQQQQVLKQPTTTTTQFYNRIYPRSINNNQDVEYDDIIYSENSDKIQHPQQQQDSGGPNNFQQQDSGGLNNFQQQDSGGLNNFRQQDSGGLNNYQQQQQPQPIDATTPPTIFDFTIADVRDKQQPQQQPKTDQYQYGNPDMYISAYKNNVQQPVLSVLQQQQQHSTNSRQMDGGITTQTLINKINNIPPILQDSTKIAIQQQQKQNSIGTSGGSTDGAAMEAYYRAQNSFDTRSNPSSVTTSNNLIQQNVDSTQIQAIYAKQPTTTTVNGGGGFIPPKEIFQFGNPNMNQQNDPKPIFIPNIDQNTQQQQFVAAHSQPDQSAITSVLYNNQPSPTFLSTNENTKYIIDALEQQQQQQQQQQPVLQPQQQQMVLMNHQSMIKSPEFDLKEIFKKQLAQYIADSNAATIQTLPTTKTPLMGPGDEFNYAQQHQQQQQQPAGGKFPYKYIYNKPKIPYTRLPYSLLTSQSTPMHVMYTKPKNDLPILIPSSGKVKIKVKHPYRFYNPNDEKQFEMYKKRPITIVGSGKPPKRPDSISSATMTVLKVRGNKFAEPIKTGPPYEIRVKSRPIHQNQMRPITDQNPQQTQQQQQQQSYVLENLPKLNGVQYGPDGTIKSIDTSLIDHGNYAGYSYLDPDMKKYLEETFGTKQKLPSFAEQPIPTTRRRSSRGRHVHHIWLYRRR